MERYNRQNFISTVSLIAISLIDHYEKSIHWQKPQRLAIVASVKEVSWILHEEIAFKIKRVFKRGVIQCNPGLRPPRYYDVQYLIATLFWPE